MPSMPSHSLPAAGKAPRPIKVEVMGKPVSRTSSRNSWLALGSRVDDAAARIEHRFPGVRHQLDGLRDGRRLTLQAWLIGLVLDVLGAGVGSGGELDILGDVDHHRTRPARAGDVERLVQHAGQVIDVADQPVVLGAGPG